MPDLADPATLVLLAVALGVAAVAVTASGLLLRHPALLVVPWLVPMFTVPEAVLANADAGVPLWARGQGQLIFPFVHWGLLGAVAWAGAAGRLEGRPFASAPIVPWLSAFGALLAGHLLVGLWLGVPLADVLGPSGFSNLVWMGAFVLLTVNAVRSERDARRLADAIVVLAGLRAGYGLARFVFAGGDPTNVYANVEKLALKITFFDIGDSLVCTVGATVALLRAIGPPVAGRTRVTRAANLAVVLLCAATVALTFRRTLQGGFLLAMIVVTTTLPRRQRLIGLTAAVPLALLGLTVAAGRRLGQLRHAETGLLGWVYDLMPDPFGPDNPRILELKLAWASFESSPVWGLGAWGRYEGANLIFWQRGERAGEFLHSGLLHLALKAGVVGVLMFAIAAFVWVRSARREPGTAPGPLEPLRVAGLAGMAFVLPDLVIGTPLIQIRTTLLWALCLALPAVARVSDPRPAPVEAVERGRRSRRRGRPVRDPGWAPSGGGGR